MSNRTNERNQQMKGVYRSGASMRTTSTQTIPFTKRKLPYCWGIDLVMVAIMVALTIYVIVHWQEIIFKAAQIISQVLVAATVVLMVVLVVAAVLGIRNKKRW